MGVKFNPFTSKLDIVDSPSGEFSDIELALGTDTAPSLSFTGDPNTGIYSPGADQVALTTAGSERARIDSSGRLLVGTSSSPSGGYAVAEAALFLVQGRAGSETDSGRINIQRGSVPTIPNQGIGGIYFTDSSNNGYASIESSCDGATGTDDYPGRLVFSTTANGAATPTERMRIDNQGRVGIGTTSPGAKIHIEESLTSGTDQTIQRITTAQGGSFNIRCSDLSSAAPDWEFFTGNSEDIVFSPSSSEKARIDSSGRLLVGTASSASQGCNLQIRSDIGVNAEFIRSADNSGGAYVALTKTRGTAASPTEVSNGDDLGTIDFIGYDGATYRSAASIASQADGTWTDGGDTTDNPGRLVFSTTADSASSPTERMRIDNKGKISTFASTEFNYIIRNSQAAGTTYAFLYGLHSATGTITGGTNSFVVWNNGNVLNANNSYTGISDAKLKENIVDANSQWDDLKALQVRNYNLKEGQTHTQIGLVAQEVELVSPGLVSESPDRDEEGNDLGTVTKSVNYSVLYMKAVKALQEAMERIEVLEAKVNALEGN